MAICPSVPEQQGTQQSLHSRALGLAYGVLAYAFHSLP